MYWYTSSWWFQPTHLKNMIVKLDHFPQIGIKNHWVATTRWYKLPTSTGQPDFWTINSSWDRYAECDSWKQARFTWNRWVYWAMLWDVLGTIFPANSWKTKAGFKSTHFKNLQHVKMTEIFGNIKQLSVFPYGPMAWRMVMPSVGVDKSTDIPFGWVFMTHYRYLKDFLRPTETTSNLSSAATPPSPSAEVGSCNGKKKKLRGASSSWATVVLHPELKRDHCKHSFPYRKQTCWSEVVVFFSVPVKCPA